MSQQISDEAVIVAANLVKEYCTDRGCYKCPISCRWDGPTRIPTQIPANWDIKEVDKLGCEEQTQ